MPTRGTDRLASTDALKGKGAMDAGAIRKALARSLTEMLTRLIALQGTENMAAQLVLLKRELSRGHDILRPLRSEANYLSILVLVENALTARGRETLSGQELLSFKDVVEIGVTERRVTHEHYKSTFKRLNHSGFPTSPLFDLEPEFPPFDPAEAEGM
jgi:hypothetical protein